MMYRSTGLLLVLLSISLFSQSQMTRKYTPDKKTPKSETLSLFDREIKNTEEAASLGKMEIGNLISVNVLPLSQLTEIRLAYATEFRSSEKINGSSWSVLTKYVRPDTAKLFAMGETYELTEIIRIKTLPQDDSLQNYTSTEKIFYWRSSNTDNDFAITYTEYKLGGLRQLMKQVYAGKNKVAALSSPNGIKIMEQAELANNAGQFAIYPNPTNRSEVTISFNAAKANAPVMITMYDITGRSVKSFKRNTGTVTGLSVIKLDIGQHPAGVYMLQFSHNGKSMMQKLVITR